MTPATYDAWYETPRGHWIGNREFALLARMLDARPGETLLDVGCGTGYFTRRFARETKLKVTGIDIDPGMLAFGRAQAPEIGFARGDAECLPFADACFDHVVAVTSLCFVADERRAVREMLRVARRRVALGLLNRHSVLYLRKRRGQAGGYAGARWHSRTEACALLANTGYADVSIRSALFLADGGTVDRMLEHVLPSRIPLGGFLAVAAGRPPDTQDHARRSTRQGASPPMPSSPITTTREIMKSFSTNWSAPMTDRQASSSVLACWLPCLRRGHGDGV